MRAVALTAIALVAGCGGSPSRTADLGGFAAEAAARACVTATGCGLAAGDVSSCTRLVSGVEQPDVAANAAVDATAVRCLAAAGADCQRALACLGGGAPCNFGGPSTCDGASIKSCVVVGSMGETATFDCASAGLTCVDGGNGRVGCGVRACTTSPPACSDDELISCDGAILHQMSCAAVGAACTGGATPACRGTGATCSGSQLDPGEPLRCEGSVLVRCYDGQEARFDCAIVGEGCFALSGSFACGLGGDCDPTAFSATCDGNKLNYCDQGQLASVDCVAFGFKSCDATDGRCAP